MSTSGIRGKLPPLDELALAAGIGIVLFLRPWYDGITFTEYNISFTWACAALAVFWSVLVFLGRMQVRFIMPVALLGLFFLAAILTAPFTVQYDATYRALINWSGYLMLFAVVANGVRSRASVAIILALFVVTSAAEAIYGVLHVNYIMPRTRALVMSDPSMIRRFFNSDTLTPELSARLESNRASGSLLFANALACWVLVGIPFAIGTCNALYHWLTRTPVPPRAPEKSPAALAANWRVLISTIALGFLVFLGIYLYYFVYFVFAYGENAQWSDFAFRWLFYCFVLPVVLTSAAHFYASKNGPRRMWILAGIYATALFGVMMVFCLGSTYSRGGMLATAGALVVLAGLMFLHRRVAPGETAQRVVAAALCALVLLPIAIASHAQTPTEVRAEPPKPNLNVEGVNPSFQAMVDPNTAMLRFGYWISGVRMFLTHPLTGVGLGNFGTAYPMYQIAGAGDVKPAHNDYLQTAAETGVFGLLTFLLFWLYFGVRVARSILRESDRAERWFRAGLFASVTGFLMHSFVDFNFYNPSLAALVFVFAGLCFAVTPNVQPVDRRRAIVLAMGMLVLAIWSRYAGDKVNHVDAVIGREVTRNVRLETATLLLDAKIRRDPTKDFAMYDNTVAMLIEDVKVREQIGRIFVPNNAAGTSLRSLRPGEPIPPTARLIMPPDMTAARKAALEAMPIWIQRCIDADKKYPHDPSVSGHIIQWYDKLREDSPETAQKIAAADEAIKWSEECIRRSPYQVAYHDVLGKTLWDRAALESSSTQTQYYERALESFKKCTEIYPIKPELWRTYGDRCMQYGEALIKAGDAVKGQQRFDEGKKAMQHADELEKEIHARAMGRG